MAKNTESTAVNDLIQIVTTQKPLRPDPSEDLMFSPPRAHQEMSGSRMTSTITGRAGELAPLPRHRSPNGTEQVSAVTPPVRISTASRSMSIPPIPQAAMAAPPVPAPPVLPAEARRPLPPPQRMSTQANPTLMGTGPRGIPPLPPAAPRPPQPPTPIGPGQPGSGPRVALPLAPPLADSPAVAFGPAPGETARMREAPAVQRSAVARDQTPPNLSPTISLRGLRDAADRAEKAPHEQHEETWVGTVQVQRRTNWVHLAGKLVGPMVILVVLGVFIGGYFAFDGDGGKKRTPAQPAAVAIQPSSAAVKAATDVPAPRAKARRARERVGRVPEPAGAPAAGAIDSPAPVLPAVTAPVAPPVAAPVTAPVAPPVATPVAPPVAPPAPAVVAKVEPPAPVVAKPAPAVPSPNLVATPTPSSLVDVRIDSKPSGATVMLVDRGKTTFLGNTPIATAVDPSRTYELVFSYANKPSQIEKLDPATTKRVAVTLGKRGATTKIDAPKVDAPKVDAPRKARATVETPEAPKAPKVASAVVEPKPAGEGTLMISSKPPCEIYIDGKATGLTTPQRAITVAAGSHKVTLVNTAENIKKTISVQVTADEPTKVIQDLMK